uniref:Uncharacterized protein n=1 Tax=viral metagenome TaxID=1070528 RepID=A0A6C0JYE6_9ZZZZ
MRQIPIKDDLNFARDMKSNAIIRTNPKELNDFNSKRARILKDMSDKEESKLRLEKLENDMACIKKLIQDMASIRSENAH